MRSNIVLTKLVRTAGLAVAALNLAVASHAALTWHWQSTPSDPNIGATIAASMNAAVADFNANSNYTGDIPVVYNSGVPTAQTDGYMGTIEFGGSNNQRTAEHEMSHWLGTGTYSTWSNFSSTGQWTGANAIAREHMFDGPNAVLSCDSLHYWPYGANYDNEPWGFRHIAMCGALRADMGLSDTTKWPTPNGTYRLQNRLNGQYLDNLGKTTNGTGVYQWASSSSNNQKWNIVPIGGGYYKIQCVTGGLYLDDLGNTANGSAIGQWSSSGSWNQQWALTPTDSGYFNIVCRGSGQVVDNYGSTSNGAPMVNWGWWFGNDVNQEWRLTN
jgi:hypothetical protein